LTIKIINATPSGLLSQRKPEVFKNGISVKLPGDYRTVGMVKYIGPKTMINEPPFHVMDRSHFGADWCNSQKTPWKPWILWTKYP